MDGFYLKDVTDSEPASLVSGPSYGRGDVLPTGVVGYAPDSGFRGEDSMEINLMDAENLVVTFIVGNRPPDVVTDSYTTTMDTPILESAPGMLGNDSDPDGDAITARIDTQPENGVAMAYSSGLFLYWPNEGFVGEDQFQYSAIDEYGAESAAMVTVQVNALALSEVTRTFEIRNMGDGDLVLTGEPSPILISGPDAADFTVTKQPDIVIPSGESTFFDVTFDPEFRDYALQIRTAIITIPNNGLDGMYTFSIQGMIEDGEPVSIDVPIGMQVGPASETAGDAPPRSCSSSLSPTSDGLWENDLWKDDLLPELLPDLVVDLVEETG